MTNIISGFRHRSEETLNDAELFTYVNALEEQCKNLYARALNFETFSLEGAMQLEKALDDFTRLKEQVSIREIESGNPVKEIWDLNGAIFQAAADSLVQVGIWYKKVAIERRRGVRNPSSAEFLKKAVNALDFPEAAVLKERLTEFIGNPEAASPITRVVQESRITSRKKTVGQSSRRVQEAQRAPFKKPTPPPATDAAAASIKLEKKLGFFERLLLFSLSFFCNPPPRKETS